jgi:tetratricopeptide (TPR) repeat protein
MQLARWFGNRPIGPRRAWEQPFQLWKAGAWTELSDVLSQADMFELVHQYGSNQELHRYWLDLAPVLDTSVVDHYQKILDQWRAEIPSDQGISLSWRLQNFLQFEGETGAFMLQLAEEGWRWCELQYGPVDIRSIRRLGAFASLLSLSKENLQRARTLREDACQKMEAATGPDDPALAAQFLGLAKICLLQGDKGFALSSARRALRISEQSVGLDHPRLVSYLNCLTDILRAIGGRVIHQQSRLLGRKELLEAIQIQTRCLRILAISYGLNHLDSAQTMVTLGKLFTDVDDPVKAERAFRQALKTFSRLLGEQHPRTKTTQILLVKFAERQNPNAGGADRGEG